MKPTHTFQKRDGTEITYVDYYKQVGLFPLHPHLPSSKLREVSLFLSKSSSNPHSHTKLPSRVSLQHNSRTCPFPSVPAIFGLTQILILSPMVIIPVVWAIALKSRSNNVTSLLKIFPSLPISLGAISNFLGSFQGPLWSGHSLPLELHPVSFVCSAVSAVCGSSS